MNREILQFAALHYSNRYSGFAVVNRRRLTLAHRHHALRVQDLSKHNMLSIEPVGLGGCDKELTPILIGLAGIGHAQSTGLMVLVQKVFIGKGGCSVNTHLPRAVAIDNVAALWYEVIEECMRDNTSEQHFGK
jgi:hypothetical protein